MSQTPHSLVDDLPWPSQLTAQVVEPGPNPRIHGYSAEGDLAQHYGFVELVLLALTGELPDPDAARSVEVAFSFLMPLGVDQGPAHLGVLSRACATSTAASLSLLSMAAAEHAAQLIEQHRSWLRWLDGNEGGDPPAGFCAITDAEQESVARLRSALPEGTPALELLNRYPDLSRGAALLAVFHRSGLQTADQIHAALFLASLPCAVAETFSAEAGALAEYPVNLPRIRYCSKPEQPHPEADSPQKSRHEPERQRP